MAAAHMPSFKFRIRFELSPDDRLQFDGSHMVFDLGTPVGSIELIGRSDDKTISSATELIVRSLHGVPSEAYARQHGDAVMRALVVGAARERFGVDFGREGPRGFLTEYGKQLLAEQMGFTGQLIDDQPGLTIFEDSAETRFAKFGPGRAIVGRPAERFLHGVRASLLTAESLSPKHFLAFEVYSAAQFEHSLRARFLALITAVEILSERATRSDAPLAMVRDWKAAVMASLIGATERDQLLGALRDLERESIGGACRRLVATHIGEATAQEFRSWYTARSTLVHDGVATIDLPGSIDRIDSVVSTLLLRAAGAAI